MKIKLFCLLLTLPAVRLFAQDVALHEIAIDASPLFKTNGYTMMYRYHMNSFSVRVQAKIYYENTGNDYDNASVTPPGINGYSFTSDHKSILNTEFRLGLQRNWTYEKWS